MTNSTATAVTVVQLRTNALMHFAFYDPTASENIRHGRPTQIRAVKVTPAADAGNALLNFPTRRVKLFTRVPIHRECRYRYATSTYFCDLPTVNKFNDSNNLPRSATE